MKRFAARRPLAFVAVVGLLFVLCHYAWRLILPGTAEAIRSGCEKATAFAYALGLLAALEWWRPAGFVKRVGWRTIVPALPLAVLPLLMALFAPIRVSSPKSIALFALVAAMTGFAEEAVFRGVVVCALLSRGIMQAVILSSLWFGALHLVNLLAGADTLATALQVVVAAQYGFTATAILRYTGSIWPLILIHGLQDFMAFATAGSIANTARPAVSEVALVIAIMVPIAGYGAWLLGRRACIDSWNAKSSGVVDCGDELAGAAEPDAPANSGRDSGLS
jgi:CAAX protease family protein